VAGAPRRDAEFVSGRSERARFERVRSVAHRSSGFRSPGDELERGANLSGAHLDGANFFKAVLDGADLAGAFLGVCRPRPAGGSVIIQVDRWGNASAGEFRGTVPAVAAQLLAAGRPPDSVVMVNRGRGSSMPTVKLATLLPPPWEGTP
jgi:hypothetical protein